MSERAERYFEEALGAVRIRDYERAAGLLVEAIKLKPRFSEAWVVRGNILHACERHFDSILHYDRALDINDKLHDAWNNRGIAFADIGMWAAAEDSFGKSIAQLDALEPHMGLANMYCTLMRLPEAAAHYQLALDRGAGPDAQFNRGVTLLGLGQWQEGSRDYEARWQNTPYPPRAYRDYPKWAGEDLTGKRILLYPEQGYGDEIMALRFAAVVKMHHPTAEVIVQARGPMLRLVEGSIGHAVVPMHADEQPEADYSCPLLDVPMALGLKPEGAPFFGASLRYLQAPDRAMVDLWKKRLHNVLGDGLKVGLCWSSGGHLNTARAAQASKSIPLPWLKGLALPGVHLVSLQHDRREPIPDGLPLTDWMADCRDFADTAALTEALDLVISVDTAVAHLAGALGKPTWNFVRYSGYWPWLTAEAAGHPELAIWYPSMKLLRQPQLGNWAEPVKQATSWLRDVVQAQAVAAT